MSTILAWFTGGWSKLLPWVMALLGIIGAYVGIRQSGKNAAYTEIAQKEAKQNAEALQVNQYVNTLSDTDVDRLLRTQFGT